MWYIFKNNQCMVTCSFEPNHEDLATRGEKAIESNLILPISEVGLDNDGNIIQVIPQEPIPTPEQIQESLTAAVQSHMDNKAKERGYDNILSACSYANSIDAIFKAEALACIAWRDSVWRKCYDILAEVTAGQREIPTAEKLISELPELVWPK